MNDYERNADVSKTLTEQWKQGELSSGWYYVRLIRGEYRIDLYISDKNEWIDCPDNIIDTIVCEVPSYEEWQKDMRAKYGNMSDKCERLQKQLDFAKQAMLSAAGFLTCNPKDMQEIYPDFCAEQWALDSINKGLKQIEELNK